MSASRTQIAAMVAEAEKALGAVDILVNNAGIQHVANIEDFPAERWDAIIAINLSAVFYGMQAAIPGMKRRGWGRIINIASAHGLVASGQKVAYVAAKHGVVGMTKVAAIELANSGVTANAICPGWVLTPLVQQPVGGAGRGRGHRVWSKRRTRSWRRSSRCCGSPRRRVSAGWRCSCAPTPPKRSPACRCRSTAGWVAQ